MRSCAMLCLAAAATLFVAPGARAETPWQSGLVQPGHLVMATTANAPPMTLVLPDGQPGGFDVDLCRAIATRLGLTLDIARVDFSATLPGLVSGRYDMVCSSVSRTAARIASPDIFITDPTASAETTLLVKSADKAIAGVADGHGKRLGAVRGGQEAALAHEVYAADSQLALYPGFAELVLDLRNGRIDAAVGSSLTFHTYAEADPTLRVIAPGLHKEGTSPYQFALLVRRAEPQLFAAVNAQLAAMRADGSLAALEKRWLGPTP